MDSITQKWVRNASDELAVANGCRFREDRGQHAVDWIERNCVLYEGESAGEAMELQDWQWDVTMRLFGWVKHSERWDRDVRRFRQASIWIAKKNKKSPTLAAWALYLLCADGEPGQKVFLAAKDGQQARKIAGKHCIEMLMQNSGLMSQCTINKTEMQITHEPTRSILRPLSSANERHQEGQEGLNGSVLVDETHVVDREFITRIKRAGISRSEPLHIEVSTAGNNPDGYGKSRFDQAQRILSGEEKNDQFLAAIFAAPQDLNDADLEADPVLYGKMANPSWGHTIDPEEYLADYNSSKHDPRELRDFKMYRLNVWQNSANPWLRIEDWQRGQRSFNLHDFQGRTCYAALDLASVKDFASLCLAFDEGEERMAMFWWFFLPEETANELRHQIDIDKWKADSRVNLTLTPGGRIDYGFIQNTFADLAQRFSIQSVAYDPWNAESVTQWMESKTGVPRVDFSQSLKTLNEPTKQFEARVIDGKILHNGDPLMAWMIQNATIAPDSNGNYKPMKPGKNSIKKIDGVVTAVMAAAMLIEGAVDTAWVFIPGTLAL